MVGLDLGLRRLAVASFALTVFLYGATGYGQDAAEPGAAAADPSATTEPAAAEPAPAEPAPADAAATEPSEPAPADAAAEPAPAEPASAEAAPAEPAADAVASEPAATIPVTPVAAQPQENLQVKEGSGSAEQLDTIEVTGSRIRRTDYETAQPVLTVTREDILRTGLSSIGDLLQDLPQAGPALNTLFNNGGNGATEVDLRALGSDRTLVLVNGRRWVGGVSALSNQAVDLNTIPISIIERIDILKDGASAIYGSDAIAGVVNIITRKDVTTTDINTQVQFTNKGDGFTQNHSFSTGNVTGDRSTFLSIGYIRQNEIRAGNRDISKIPKFGTGISRGSPGTDHGFFIFIPTPENLEIYGEEGCPSDIVLLADTTAPTDPNTSVDTDPGSPAPSGPYPVISTGTLLPIIPGVPGDNLLPNQVPLCILTRIPERLGQPTDNSTDTFTRYSQNQHAYNFAPDNYLLTPQERVNIFGQLRQQFLENLGLTAEVLYNRRRSAQELAAFPLQGGGLLGGLFREGGVDETNPFNPFGQNVGQGDAASGLVGLGAFFRRLNEQGPRFFSQNVETFRVGTSLEGSFDVFERFFTWDVGYSYNESANRNIEEGLQNYDRVIKATGPVGDCEDSTDGCVPLNVFGGPGTITQEMINYFKYTGISSQRNLLNAYSANIGTEVLQLPYGPLGLALGAEVRKQSFVANPDPLVAAGRSTNNRQTPTVGEINVREAYMEFAIPLLKDWVGLDGWLPVQELDLSIAGRYSEYDTFAGKTSGKLGIRFKPFEDLLLRASISDAFRAPSVTDLFLGSIESFPSTQDPCSNYNSELRDDDPGIENVRENCANDGVPASYTQSSGQIRTQFGGNPLLTPETALSITGGFVYNPNWAPDLNIDVDYYNIEIEEAITTIGAAQVLGLCYGAAPSARSFCDRVQRNEDGSLEKLVAIPANLQTLKVSGVDLTFSYLLPVEQLIGYSGQLLGRGDLLGNTDIGQFKLTMTGAYVDTYDFSSPSPDGEVIVGLVGFGTGTGAIPRWKAQSQLLWSLGSFDASWTLRYIHHTEEICDDGFTALNGLFAPASDPIKSFEELGLCHGRKTFPKIPGLDVDAVPYRKIGSVAYHNVQFGYQLPNQLGKMTVGINNVFGKKTPVTLSAFANSFDPTLHELDDVVPYLRYVQEFE